MRTCSVCQMILNESGVCSLCGSEVKVGLESTTPQDSNDSVDLPFGLGHEPEQDQTSLPFGIDYSPHNDEEVHPANATEHEDSMLPFGLENSLESEISESEIIEETSQETPLPFGIDDAPSENKQNSREKRTKSSNNPSQNLPFGIEHIFDSPRE